MRENFNAEIEQEAEQVFAKVILAESEEIANDVLERFEAGEVWEELVLEFSLDRTTSENGGQVGWSTLTDLLARYGQPGLAAFAAPEGEVVGPFPAQGGASYLFIVEGREVRPLSEEAIQQAKGQAFNTWLQGLRDEAEVTIVDEWERYLPPPVPLGS